MARKCEVIPLTFLIYCVMTLPDKTSTTANIGVKCYKCKKNLTV